MFESIDIMEKLSEILTKMLGGYSFSSAMKEIIQLIIEGKWTSLRYKEILKEYHVRSNSVDFKEETLDVAIEYARQCLQNDALSEEEIKGMTMLKRALFIQEGDFYTYGKKEQVQGIIAAQLLKLYEDGVIDCNEAVHKADLQGLFNLSYEEFDEIVHDIAQAALERGANIVDLDTCSIKFN